MVKKKSASAVICTLTLREYLRQSVAIFVLLALTSSRGIAASSQSSSPCIVHYTVYNNHKTQNNGLNIATKATTQLPSPEPVSIPLGFTPLLPSAPAAPQQVSSDTLTITTATTPEQTSTKVTGTLGGTGINATMTDTNNASDVLSYGVIPSTQKLLVGAVGVALMYSAVLIAGQLLKQQALDAEWFWWCTQKKELSPKQLLQAACEQVGRSVDSIEGEYARSTYVLQHLDTEKRRLLRYLYMARATGALDTLWSTVSWPVRTLVGGLLFKQKATFFQTPVSSLCAIDQDLAGQIRQGLKKVRSIECAARLYSAACV